MTILGTDLRTFVADRLVARNDVSRRLFEREADRLACACQEMSRRFLRGGRLLAFGRGAAATDAQHVSVEFVHPVIVGKRALPALDVSAAFERWVPGVVREPDIVMGFDTTGGRDDAVAAAIAGAAARGAYTFALSGPAASFALEPPSTDPFIAQELVEVLYHTLWETVHVFFEHRPAEPRPKESDPESAKGSDPDLTDALGASAFLYPFLGSAAQDTSGILDEVAASIRLKAADDERLRAEVARDEAGQIANAVETVLRRLDAGASLLMFGNGGSATDANDWTIDCVAPPEGARTIPAVSLSMEPANISAIANDIGRDAIFLRQLIAHGRPGDVAIAISTSGGSSNIVAALEEARKRGMLTIALLGYDGGEILRRRLADCAVVVHCDYIPRIQEVQASVYHVMTEAWRQWRV